MQVPGATLAWCFALAVVVASLQLAGMTTQLLSGMAYGYELQGWEALVNLVMPGCICWSRSSPHVRHCQRRCEDSMADGWQRRWRSPCHCG